jgi:fused signal recognition particle receptor
MSFKDKIKQIFGLHKNVNADFFDELTDTLVEGDIGAKTAYEITESLEAKCKREKITDTNEILEELKKIISGYVKKTDFLIQKDDVNVFLVLGVNGVGKTTTVAKLANHYNKSGFNVVIAASDTFRAAAIDQLKMHGEKLHVRVVSHQDGSDPASVVFDAGEACKNNGGGIVLVDTAGRLHNKENLVRELQKIDKVAESKASAGCYKKILVLDATTGQNALRQAEVFNEACKVDAVILTKYDSTARGGILVSLGKELGIPCAFVCTGETYADISSFNPEKYISELLG